MAMKLDFVARPTNDRYHRSVIPLGGGMAIFGTIAVFIIASILIVQFLAAGGHLNFLGEGVTTHVKGFKDRLPELVVVLGSLLFLHVVGLWDDKKRLGPMFKLAMQFAAAVMLAGMGNIRVELFIYNKLITTLLSATWIVLIINVFNFLDNMDGLSAGMAMIVSGILFWAAAISGQVFVGAFAMILAGALLGFLVHNFPPAKIFMGDAGSLVLGASVAILTLQTTYYHQAQSGGVYAVFMPLVVLAVPLYDFASVTMLRISQGKSPFVGDTQHFSHRLKKRGLTDRQVAVTLYIATLCTGLGGTFLYQVNLTGAVLIFIQTILILGIIAIFEMTGKNSN
jgi:UDP-GlcNAc:undecaprenyl-phosphate GlcNAc-1-phosphate transferase